MRRASTLIAALTLPLFSFASASAHPGKRAATYSIYQDWTGTNFFDGWNFATGIDTINWGNVKWLAEPDARTNNLISISPSGTAIVKVDNTTVLPSQPIDGNIVGRNSISMSSQATFGPGSLVVFQAKHLPYGCSIWPGFWALGGNAQNWPQYGEIDIVENINAATSNSYSLHTTGSCTHPAASPATSLTETGRIGSNTDCHNTTLSNTGCVVTETQANNYGPGFASNGGGAYALEWTEDAMSFWFFPRESIPADLDSMSPNPSGWGLPGGYYPSSSCSWADHFGPQSIQIDIDLCGLWAGDNNTFHQGGGCSGLCTDLIHDPTNYDTAYFEFEFVRIFSAAGSTEPTLTLSPSGQAAPTTTASTTSPSTNGGAALQNAASSRFGLSSRRTGGMLGLALGVMGLILV